jgi:hypothetical protein
VRHELTLKNRKFERKNTNARIAGVVFDCEKFEFLFLSVDFFSVADLDNHDAQVAVLNVGDYSIVSNSIFPEFA